MIEFLAVVFVLATLCGAFGVGVYAGVSHVEEMALTDRADEPPRWMQTSSGQDELLTDETGSDVPSSNSTDVTDDDR